MLRIKFIAVQFSRLSFFEATIDQTARLLETHDQLTLVERLVDGVASLGTSPACCLEKKNNGLEK